MSAEATVQKAIQLLNQYGDIDPGASIIEKILRNTDKATTQLIFDAAYHAHGDLQKALASSVPVFFHTALVHLADDIADGDCDYIENPVAHGVTALCTLMQLFNSSMSSAHIYSKHIFDALIDVGMWQHKEIATTRWTIDTAKNAAVGLNGRQFEAYFCIAGFKTQHESTLAKAGYAFGIAGHFMNDIFSHDPRLYDLPQADRNKLIRWALTLMEESPLPFASAHVYTKPVINTLRQEAQFKLR